MNFNSQPKIQYYNYEKLNNHTIGINIKNNEIIVIEKILDENEILRLGELNKYFADLFLTNANNNNSKNELPQISQNDQKKVQNDKIIFQIFEKISKLINVSLDYFDDLKFLNFTQNPNKNKNITETTENNYQINKYDKTHQKIFGNIKYYILICLDTCDETNYIKFSNVNIELREKNLYNSAIIWQKNLGLENSNNKENDNDNDFEIISDKYIQICTRTKQIQKIKEYSHKLSQIIKKMPNIDDKCSMSKIYELPEFHKLFGEYQQYL